MANNNLTNANFANIATVNANGTVTALTTTNLTATSTVQGALGSFTTMAATTANATTVNGTTVNATTLNATGTSTLATMSATNVTSMVSTGTANFTSGNVGLGAYQEKIYSYGTTSGTISVNYNNGTVFNLTLNGDIILNSANFSNFIPGRSITMVITQDGTGGRIIGSTDLKYAGSVNTLSTPPNSIDVMNIYYNGTYYLAALVKGYV
jgi:hypothetical protein